MRITMENNYSKISNNKKIDTTPKVYITKIDFNDGTVINLERNSIVVFVGGNNCGKSQTLKEIELCLDDSNHTQLKTIKGIERDFQGQLFLEDYLVEHFFVNQQGNYQTISGAYIFAKESIKQYWNQKTLYNGLHTLFINRLTTEVRLSSSNDLIRKEFAEAHPIYKMYKNEKLAQQVSNYFHRAFDVDLIVDRNELTSIPLRIGDGPDKTQYTIADQDEYYKIINSFPRLQEQGDGMRSFASILLDSFTSDHTITLIDEPEAFLHPPQARVLGRMLADTNNRQLFIATHSDDFLQGMLDAGEKNITIVRIERSFNVNSFSVLKNDRIRELWNRSLLKYSNVFKGLFHKKVVVCESDFDCLFYQSIVNAMFENNSELIPDILFVHTNGKDRIKDIVAALKAVNVTVTAIVDFDILNSRKNFKELITAFGLNWDSYLSKDMETIYDSMNAKKSCSNCGWDYLKRIGKAGFDGLEPAAYDNVERICKAAGLFIVPVGEIECFDKTINKGKKDWVYYVLENYDLANDQRLKMVREFMKEVADY